jgi:hypothetical protein
MKMVKNMASRVENFISFRVFEKMAMGPTKKVNHLITSLMSLGLTHFVHLKTKRVDKICSGINRITL